MNLGKFFKTNTGKRIMSAILGFGLATFSEQYVKIDIVLYLRLWMMSKTKYLRTEKSVTLIKQGIKCDSTVKASA